MTDGLDHAGLKTLAKELGRPLFTLEVLRNDPFTAGSPARQAGAEWFAEQWERLGVGPGAHLRRIHYPLKDTETRAAAFEARFGEGATELDALEALHPGELARILAREIGRYHDDTLAPKIEATSTEVQADLRAINAEVRKRHSKAIAALDLEREKVAAAIAAFEKKARPVLRKIERDLTTGAPTSTRMTGRARGRPRG